MSENMKNYVEGNTKEISLPSNPEKKYKIRQVPMRNVALEIYSSGLISEEELNKQLNKKVQKKQEEQKEYISIKDRIYNLQSANSIIKLGVIEPKLTYEDIEFLPDADWNFLVNEITQFGRGSQDNLQNFRQKEDGNNPR